MEEKICPLCDGKIIGESYEVDEFPHCCKECFERVKKMKEIESSPELSKLNDKYVKWNIFLFISYILIFLGITIINILLIIVGLALMITCLIKKKSISKKFKKK